MTDAVCVLVERGEACRIAVDARGERLVCGFCEQNRVDVYRVSGGQIALM